MFATSARIVPDSAFAWRELSFTLNSSRFSMLSTFTCGDKLLRERAERTLHRDLVVPTAGTSTLSGSTTG